MGLIEKHRMVSFIICSNGYGHLKRVLLVVNEILKSDPTLRINLFCSTHLIIMAQNEINFKASERVNYYSHLALNEISWITGELSNTRYEAWVNDIKNCKVLQKSVLIISDNHVAPLQAYSKTLLMGNFLWHDVSLIDTLDKKIIFQHENDLLNLLHPSMLSVKDVVMPNVIAQTQAVQLPWFCTRYEKGKTVLKGAVLFTGGGTELVNRQLAEMAKAVMIDLPAFTCFVDREINKLLKHHGFKSNLFSFSDEDFETLDVVVCRPGVGILTDCVKYGITPIVINDDYNREISHNAYRVQELGIGKVIPVAKNISENEIQQLKNILTDEVFLKSSKERINNLETNGAEKAATYILKQYQQIG